MRRAEVEELVLADFHLECLKDRLRGTPQWSNSLAAIVAVHQHIEAVLEILDSEEDIRCSQG